ncbi:MAG TPA: alkaline phosphatase family protein, partial [Pseudonocardiaceae bacterium]|nr:alkaline phosphatase family protein [Pseudonocardiaceae bacterium]
IADELEAQGKSWKAYEQGMGVPCNVNSSTEHTYDSYYAPDDAPFINYTDVSSNSARCKAHLVDTGQLTTDLAGTATTPAFSWLAADDYYDGESAGNGNATSRQVQDGWLKQTIAPIIASPAWRTQRSLLIVTWDEDMTDADNHVATVMVGSQGSVPAGYTDSTRYDHYSTGRTIENALGLAPITANDRYATPFAFGGTASSTLTATQSGSTVTFQYATPAATTSTTNWIGIYPAGATPGTQGSTSWQYAPNPSGTLSFSTAGLAAGSYNAWYLYDNGYTALAGPVPFAV